MLGSISPDMAAVMGPPCFTPNAVDVYKCVMCDHHTVAPIDSWQPAACPDCGMDGLVPGPTVEPSHPRFAEIVTGAAA